MKPCQLANINQRFGEFCLHVGSSLNFDCLDSEDGVKTSLSLR